METLAPVRKDSRAKAPTCAPEPAPTQPDSKLCPPCSLPGLPATLRITGRVAESRTGNGIEGIEVRAVTCLESEVVIARAKTAAGGRFQLELADDPAARERFLALRELPDARTLLRAFSSDGTAVAHSAAFALDPAYIDLELTVDLPAGQVTTADWDKVSNVFRRARVARLSDMVRALDGTQPVAGLDALAPSTRLAMLDALEQAFLDPTKALRQALGAAPTLLQTRDDEFMAQYARRLQQFEADASVLTAYSDLLARARRFDTLENVDWVIDPALLDGNLEGALNRFSDRYKLFDRFENIFFSRGSLVGYRDYLVAIWTTFAPTVEYTQNVKLTAAEALQQLTTRFHQNFQTNDDVPVVANMVVIRILTEILTAPATAAGFGLAPASIPVQGTKPPRQYLDELIALSGQGAAELGLRYRIDFTRPDAAQSSPVQENIAALQGFYRDGFQSKPDPFHIAPDKHNQPIIPDILEGVAPFFLYYDEWLRQQAPFYPQNHLDIRRILPIDITPESRQRLRDRAAGKIPETPSHAPVWQFCNEVANVWDKLQEGHAHFYTGQFPLARIAYQQAKAFALSAAQMPTFGSSLSALLIKQRKALPLKSMKDIEPFSKPVGMDASGWDFPSAPDWARERMALRLAYYALFTVPVCLGEAELALGDYESAVFHFGQASRFQVAVARESDSGGYRPHYLMKFSQYYKGDKPYSVNLLKGYRMADGFHPFPADDSRYPVETEDKRYNEYYDTSLQNAVEMLANDWALRLPHPAEIKLFALKQANAMLEWADALYRQNEATSMARARELYKGVMWLHGMTPKISPTWPAGIGALLPLPPFYFLHAENPALLSQTGRSERGIYQIDNGLNYFGERDDIVPILRYRPLKEAADRMAATARGAQQDFLSYTQHVEAAITARLQLANFLQKSRAQSAIADEATAIAQHDVKVAQDQVAAVQAAIKAKQDEIADANSILSQFGDFFKGAKNMIGGLPDDTKTAVASGVKSEVLGEAMVGKGMLGLGAAGSIMAGFGIFAVVGYVTLDGMASAAMKRDADLKTLLDKALPAAQAVVTARNHGVNITRLQKVIAQADVDLAQSLIAFEQNRTLNLAFWNEMSQIARRLLRRYLELGARLTWLAERALAYEQNRTIRIVRMDYFPERLQGVSGADLMQADLAELEATRIEGLKRTVPLRRTLSLARDFPLQYAALKQTGRCAFRTAELTFRQAYPGTSDFRLRAVGATVQQLDLTQPLRGSLVNFGVSISRPGQPGEHLLVRPADSLPLSEFALHRDMAVYGLPGEMLLTFEGSSAESFWELSFPRAANPAGLGGLADVLLTFDLFAEFSPDRYTADLAAPVTSTRKWVLMSAAQYAPAAMTALAGAANTVSIPWDLRRLNLPRQETNRRVKSVALLAVAPTDLDFVARFTSNNPGTARDIGFVDGVVMSSLQPLPTMPALPAAPLNDYAEMDPEQIFTLSINKAANPGVNFTRVSDVILAVEYEAQLPN